MTAPDGADDAGVRAVDQPGPAAPDAAGTSPLARRLGPIVALLGVLGVVVTIGWIAVAPDNVVGTVADAGVTVPATAVAVPGQDDDTGTCLRLVEGDGADRLLCPDVDGLVDAVDAWWADDGRIAVPVRDGTVLVDPTTGGVEGPVTDVGSYPSDGPFREDVHVDGQVVRRGPWGSDGAVVLDLGGPAGGLDGAAQSPDGRWVVAVDRDGRVLVAETADPATVHVWFEVDEDRWFDPWTALRWDE